MTYLELVNSTLRRLRRQEVNSVSSTQYSKLIGDLVNLSKREVEDAWPWLALMTTTTLSVTSGTDTYTLTGYGDRYRIQQVLNTTNDGTIRAVRQMDFRRWSEFSDVDGLPNYWRIKGYTSGDPQIQFWPTPDSNVTVKVYSIVPQATLTANGTEISVPYHPVLLGAYARALDERGEDAGTTQRVANADYALALSDAIAHDNHNRAHGYESDWRVA